MHSLECVLGQRSCFLLSEGSICVGYASNDKISLNQSYVFDSKCSAWHRPPRTLGLCIQNQTKHIYLLRLLVSVPGLDQAFGDVEEVSRLYSLEGSKRESLR